jgi:hypothetical protein
MPSGKAGTKRVPHTRVKVENKAPWAIKPVITKKKKRPSELVDVKLEESEGARPWQHQASSEESGEEDSLGSESPSGESSTASSSSSSISSQESDESDEDWGHVYDPPVEEQEIHLPPEEPEHDREPRWICAQNYAAVEATDKDFGLIPMGVENGVRSLVMHVPKGKQGWKVFQNVQPGGVIQVVRRRNGGREARNLRVRYTTPTRYTAPGQKVSCLTIGVDDAEWQSLMVKPRHI